MVNHLIDYLVSEPNVQRGRPCIVGTGITVHNIADDYNNGMTVAEIVEGFDLTASQVHAALAYYYDHKEQIDKELQEDKKRDEALYAEFAPQSDEIKRRVEERLRMIKGDQ